MPVLVVGTGDTREPDAPRRIASPQRTLGERSGGRSRHRTVESQLLGLRTGECRLEIGRVDNQSST